MNMLIYYELNLNKSVSTTMENHPVSFQLLAPGTSPIPKTLGVTAFKKAVSMGPLTVKVTGILKSTKYTTMVSPHSLTLTMNFPTLDGSLILDNLEDHMKISKANVDRKEENLKLKWNPTHILLKIARQTGIAPTICDSKTNQKFFFIQLHQLKPSDIFLQDGRVIE